MMCCQSGAPVHGITVQVGIGIWKKRLRSSQSKPLKNSLILTRGQLEDYERRISFSHPGKEMEGSKIIHLHSLDKSHRSMILLTPNSVHHRYQYSQQIYLG